MLDRDIFSHRDDGLQRLPAVACIAATTRRLGRPAHRREHRRDVVGKTVACWLLVAVAVLSSAGRPAEQRHGLPYFRTVEEALDAADDERHGSFGQRFLEVL